MKKLQQFCAVVILTFVLSLSALGGEMGCPGDVPPPPPPDQTNIVSDTGSSSVTNTSDTQTSVVAVAPVTEAALALLPSVLSLV